MAVNEPNDLISRLAAGPDSESEAADPKAELEALILTWPPGQPFQVPAKYGPALEELARELIAEKEARGKPLDPEDLIDLDDLDDPDNEPAVAAGVAPSLDEPKEMVDAALSRLRHEMRQPLAVIQGFSELLRDADLSREEIREYAAEIFKEAAHLAEVIAHARG